MVPGWVTGATPDVQGKHHVHSVLNPSFVAESRVGSRLTGKVIIFHKISVLGEKGKAIATYHF